VYVRFLRALKQTHHRCNTFQIRKSHHNARLRTVTSGGFRPRFGKNAIFGHALFGGAHSALGAGVSLPVLGGFSTGVNSATAFAMAFGGGADIGVNNRIAIRPVQIDYLYTHFNSFDALTTGLTSTTTSHQNSFRYSGGVVLRF